MASIFSCCFGGGRSSSKSGKPAKDAAQSDIDKELELSGHQQKLKFKILLLGSGESGKSTVLKQLKLIHRINLTPQEIKEYSYSLKRNSIECMCVLIDQAAQFGYEFETQELKARAEVLKKLGPDCEDDLITIEVADAIKGLWDSEAIQKTFERKNEFWILDAAEYYFSNIERFVQEDFEPSEEDLVMARVMTTGIITTEISAQPLLFQVVDVGGQRNERRKWIHCFDDINGIVFVVNLAGYNSVLFEDRNTNRMQECLNLFKQTVNNPIFSNTPIFLVFNKKDLFEKLIQKDPITVCPCFEDYTGTNDLMECLSYISTKFKAQIQVGGDERVQVFHIAARFKRDVKTTWDDLVSYVKKKNAKQIDAALKALTKNE